MTIKIIERPDRGESWNHIVSNVRSVSCNEITFHDGSKMHKNYFAKVEVLTLADEPEYGTEEYKAFEETCYRKNFLGIYCNSWYEKMREEQFEALYFTNHF